MYEQAYEPSFPEIVPIAAEWQSTFRNRRRHLRHRVHTRAYVSFTGPSKGTVLSEILDIGENGIAVRCSSPLGLNRSYQLCIELQDASDHIYTTGDAVWSGASGHVGFHFSNLPAPSLLQMQNWLSRNAGDYSDRSAALSVAQREAECLGPDLEAALGLIAARAQALVRGSAAAIALASSEPTIMVCQASAGDAPPVGAKLQVGSGFSGECVRTGKVLRCDDTETDIRLDRERCRVLGIRSIIAAPVRVGENVIGIIEVFSPKPGAFNENDSVILQRLAEILASFNHSAHVQRPAVSAVAPAAPVSSPADPLIGLGTAPLDDSQLRAAMFASP